jgi:hypothetical protein
MDLLIEGLFSPLVVIGMLSTSFRVSLKKKKKRKSFISRRELDCVEGVE